MVEEKLGKTLCLVSLYNRLHRHGWRKLAPDTRHPKGDALVCEDWGKVFCHVGKNHAELPGKMSAALALPG
jgi:hypothetical protein